MGIDYRNRQDSNSDKNNKKGISRAFFHVKHAQLR